VPLSKRRVEQNPPRSPFTKGEDAFFIREKDSRGAPLSERGVGGNWLMRRLFILQRVSISGWLPMGAQSVGLSPTAKPPALPVDSSLTCHFRHFFKPSLQYSNTPAYIPSTLHKTVMIAVATIILIIPVTTADVAASPTAEALRPHCIPLRQPERATRTPKTAL
jgi:hypothetical protein